MDVRYWDASAFIAFLEAEAERVDLCAAAIKEAVRGRLLIVTSALTLTEVIKLKGRRPIGADKAETLTRFFEHEWIAVRNVDRRIAEHAREFIWDYPKLHPKDSIHLATALRFHIGRLETFDDEHLIPLDNTIGTPPLRIGYPRVDQGTLPLQDGGRPDKG